MADPVFTTIYENQWVKVATKVVTGFLRLPFFKPSGVGAPGSFDFYWTSRDTGGTAPDNSDITDGALSMPLFETGRSDEISCVAAADIYVICKNRDDDDSDSTKIRVDLV